MNAAIPLPRREARPRAFYSRQGDRAVRVQIEIGGFPTAEVVLPTVGDAYLVSRCFLAAFDALCGGSESGSVEPVT